MGKYILWFILFIVPVNGMSNDSIYNKLLSERILPVREKIFTIYDVAAINVNNWTSLFKIPEHPAFDDLLTPDIEKQLLIEINNRKKKVNKDTLYSADIFYTWQPYFNWLYYIDPHYIIDFKITAKKANEEKLPHINQLLFNYTMINDTIIVDKSADPLFKKGDMIVSLNNISVSNYIKYNYKHRYNNIYFFMKNYYYNNISDTFEIKLIRENETILIKTEGLKSEQRELFKWSFNIQEFKEAKSAYINIGAFDNNQKIINTLRSNIKKFKRKGYSNIILDLRQNPGGSGDKFDELMSIFINKPVVQYQKGARLKISEKVLSYYDFLTEDMIGQLVNLPDSEIIKEFKTKPKMYIDGVNYYVLMSTNTGSTAATFVNILQYNNAAKLVGEPLLHNALRFGEVIAGNYLTVQEPVPCLLYPTSISTVEYDEYTKAVDGVIMPDIPIPYVASDYLTGKDAMLEKLLEYIKTQR